jgi:hypothetical protein
VQQAADILGISTEATRQRIKRGTLPTERDENGNVFVLLDADGMHTNTDRTRTNDNRTVDCTALIESQQDQIAHLRLQLDKEREASAELRRIIAALTQRIPELEPARNSSADARESPVMASEEPSRGEAPEESEESKKRPWWRRIFE